jgi:hypothetical protein
MGKVTFERENCTIYKEDPVLGEVHSYCTEGQSDGWKFAKCLSKTKLQSGQVRPSVRLLLASQYLLFFLLVDLHHLM